jgi:hypothetical protein
MIKLGGYKSRLSARLMPETLGYVHVTPKQHSRKSQLVTTLAAKTSQADVFGSE